MTLARIFFGLDLSLCGALQTTMDVGRNDDPIGKASVRICSHMNRDHDVSLDITHYRMQWLTWLCISRDYRSFPSGPKWKRLTVKP